MTHCTFCTCLTRSDLPIGVALKPPRPPFRSDRVLVPRASVAQQNIHNVSYQSEFRIPCEMVAHAAVHPIKLPHFPLFFYGSFPTGTKKWKLCGQKKYVRQRERPQANTAFEAPSELFSTPANSVSSGCRIVRCTCARVPRVPCKPPGPWLLRSSEAPGPMTSSQRAAHLPQ